MRSAIASASSTTSSVSSSRSHGTIDTHAAPAAAPHCALGGGSAIPTKTARSQVEEETQPAGTTRAPTDAPVSHSVAFRRGDPPDSDADLHSSDEEDLPLTGTKPPTEGPRVTGVNYLLGRKEPDPTDSGPGSLGSLNHHGSINKQYDRDETNQSCGCCRRNTGWTCIGLIVIIALALFINVHYHIGPDSSKLVSYLSGDGAPSSSSSPATLALEAEKTHEERLARKIQLNLLKPGGGGGSSSSSVHDDGLSHSSSVIPKKVDLSGDQMRAEVLKLSHALDYMNLGNDQLQLPDLPKLPDMPGTLDSTMAADDPTAIPDATDLEAELTKKTGGVEDVLTRVEEERAKARLSHLPAQPNFHPHPSAIDSPQTEAADAALLKKAREQAQQLPPSSDPAAAGLVQKTPEQQAADDLLDRQSQAEFVKGLDRHKQKMAESIGVMEAHARRLEKEIAEEEASKVERKRAHEERMREEEERAKKIEEEKAHLAHLAEVAAKEPTPDRIVGKKAQKEKEGEAAEEDPEDADAPSGTPAEDAAAEADADPSSKAESDAGSPPRSLILHNSSIVGAVTAPVILPHISSISDLTPLGASTFHFHDRSLFPHLRAPPSLKAFPFCRDCAAHCRNVLSAVDWAASHLSESDQHLKFAGLSASLSRFFRGTTHLFWQVLAHPTPAQKSIEAYTSHTATTFLSGDLHLLNLGSYDSARFGSGGRGALLPEGRLQFDFNDFDHAFVGANYWTDLERTMVSIVISMTDAKRAEDDDDDKKAALFTHAEVDTVLRAYAAAYHTMMGSFVDSDLELSYSLDLERADLPKKSIIGRLLHKMQKKKTRVKMLDKFAPMNSSSSGGVRQLDLSHHMAAATPEEEDELRSNWKNYLASLGAVHRSRMRRSPDKQTSRLHSISYHPAADTPEGLVAFYHIKSLARRVGAGLGSLGVRRYFVLVEGPSSDDQDDDILLDVKLAATPEWRPFQQPAPETELLASDALRIVAAASAFSPAHGDDIHLGFLELASGSFVVRARSPFKGEVDFADVRALDQWVELAEQVARITAANHARADDDYDQRLVPTSFEDAFTKQLVPEHKREEWTQALVKHAWEQFDQRHTDFACWTAEHKEQKEEKTDADDEKAAADDEKAASAAAAADREEPEEGEL